MEFKSTFFTDQGKYTCQVTKASIDKPIVDIVSYKGKHKQGKTNNSVTRARFIDSKFQYFPRNPQRIFPSLNYLKLTKCDLREISRQDLVGLEKLIRLDLDNNQLKSLPDDLFTNMPNLKYVWLDCNKIEFASSKLIEPIVANQLEWFYLTNNTSINEFFDSVKSTGCRTIQALMAKIDEKCTPPIPTTPFAPTTRPTSSVPPTCPTWSAPPTTQPTPPTTQPTPSTSRLRRIRTAARRELNCCAAQDILKSLNEQRQLGQLTDFVINVGSRRFPVHKNILAAHSSVWAEKLAAETKVRISGSSEEAVGDFLAYFYEQKRPVAQNAKEIIKLAAQFNVTKLKAICEEIISTSIDGSNAHEIFKVAREVESEELKATAFRELQESFAIALDESLMNDPELLQNIVDKRKELEDLMGQAKAKKPRLS